MYVFDLDGTLSIVGDRVGHLNEDPPNWDAFYARCGEDDVHRNVMRLYSILHHNADGRIIILTGRRESCRQDTIRWFGKWNIPRPAYLLMRPNGDYVHDTELKPRLLRDIGATPDTVTGIFEDRNSVVKEWRRLGYTCFQVAEGDF